MTEQIEPVMCEAERSARPCGEAASVAFRIGALGTGSPGTTLIPRCRSHAEEFRIMLQRFMRPDTWSEQTISRK